MKSLFYPAFFFSFVCFCLGLWQWQRLEWKQNLLQSIESKCETGAPKNLPPVRAWGNLDKAQWQWQKVRFSGSVEKTKIKLWQGRKGYQEFSLVRLDDGKGGAILIWGEAQPTSVTGAKQGTAILYPSQQRRWFDPKNDKQKALFHILETKEIIAALKGSSSKGANAPLIFPFAAKLGGTCPSLPNNHLLYMLTWWLLMIFMPLVVIFGKKEE